MNCWAENRGKFNGKNIGPTAKLISPKFSVWYILVWPWPNCLIFLFLSLLTFKITYCTHLPTPPFLLNSQRHGVMFDFLIPALGQYHTFINSVVGTSFQKVAGTQLCYQNTNPKSKMKQMQGSLTNEGY